MKTLPIAISILLLVSFSAKSGEGISFISGNFSEALAKAKSENKLVFVDCYAVWCGPCKWMNTNVFNDEKVYTLFDRNFVSIALDMEKGEGLDIAKKYSVKNYPTFLWLNGEGNQVHRTVGAAPVEDFVTIANRAMDPKGNLAYLTTQYESGNRLPAIVLQYAHSLHGAYDTRYQTIADEYFQSQPENELTSTENWNAIHSFTPNINSHTYGVISKSLPKFYDKYGKDSVNKLMDELAISSLSFAKQQKDTILLKNALNKLKESKNLESNKRGLLGELDFYKGNKNFEKYTAVRACVCQRIFYG